MLAIVNHELRVHRDAQHPKVARDPFVRSRDELGLAINRCRDRREDVLARILDNVPRHLGNARLIQLTLRSEFRLQLLLVEDEQLWEKLEGAHRDVVLSAGLAAAKGYEFVVETARRHTRCCGRPQLGAVAG